MSSARSQFYDTFVRLIFYDEVFYSTRGGNSTRHLFIYNRPSEKTFRFLCSRRCSLLLVLIVRLNMKSHFLLIYIYVNLLKRILCSTTMNQASTIAFTHDNTYGIASPKNILLATHVPKRTCDRQETLHTL